MPVAAPAPAFNGYFFGYGGFVWQLIAGVDIPVTERLALFMQYRYFFLSEQSFTTDFGDFTNTTDSDPSSHSILFGARVSF